MAGKAPIIISISELRRDTRRVIFRMERSHLPVFITQRGYVSAVLLSREEYDTMCVLRDKGIQAISPRASASDRLLGAEDEDRLLGAEDEDRLPSVREVTDRPEYWNDW